MNTERVRLPAGPELHVERSGAGERALVALHGGPGLSCEYLAPLHQLARPNRAVVMYDQAGGGRSTEPRDLEHATIDWLADDLAALLDHLALDTVDLLGHSFGAMLALQFALDHPGRVRSLVLAGGAFSARRAAGSLVERLIAQRGPDVVARALSSEVRGDADDPDYWTIVGELFEPDTFPTDPAGLAAWRAEFDAGPMGAALWGPWMFTVTGSLRDWDVTERLRETAVPALVTNGTDDYARAEDVLELADLLPRGEYVCIGRGHDGFLREPAFYALVDDFLARS